MEEKSVTCNSSIIIIYRIIAREDNVSETVDRIFYIRFTMNLRLGGCVSAT